jgi:hypothetical protein
MLMIFFIAHSEVYPDRPDWKVSPRGDLSRQAGIEVSPQQTTFVPGHEGSIGTVISSALRQSNTAHRDSFRYLGTKFTVWQIYHD